MIRKLFITPWFGPLPPWMPAYWRNAERLRGLGYDWLFETNEAVFRSRVRRTLGVEAPPMAGTGNVWDFRAAFGAIYATEIKGYDFWGHTDFDCVYGRVERWVTDEFLDGLDVHSNALAYVNGCWSLYRNTPVVNEAFRRVEEWRWYLTLKDPSGWVEESFSDELAAMADEGMIRKTMTQWQTYKEADLARLRFDGERLMCGDEEQMMGHFRRTKVYPPGCLT